MTSPRAEESGRLRRFLDAEGRVRVWPSKRGNQLLVLGYLASRFDPDVRYTVAEVNVILNRHHTFGDWARLRRALVDERIMDRRGDGSMYWLVTGGEATPED